MGRRLLVIASSFPRHGEDLAGHFVGHWCRSLVDRGAEVDVLCWHGPGACSRQVQPGLRVRFIRYAWPGAQRLFFGAGAPENLTEHPLRAWLAVPAVAVMVAAALDACRRRSYDAVIGHWMVPGGLIARWVAEVMKLDSAVVGHSGGVHVLGALPEVIGRAIARRVCRGATSVPTEPLRKRLVALSGSEDIEVAPMGYAPSPISVESKNRGNDALRIGFLGRLVPIKGLETVLRAVERLRQSQRSVTLDVVGTGPRRGRWEAMAGETVHFVGAKYGLEKWHYLHRWDALVVPSKKGAKGRHEGLPVSLLEGASVGAVPLVSGVPGVEKWLARPTRQLIGDGDVDGWCRALGWIDGLDRGESTALRARTMQQVAPLAWPSYARWWQQWIGGRVTSPSSRTS